MTAPAHAKDAPILAASVGVGFKPEHAEAVFGTDHGLGFFEVHAENYMGEGGPPHRMLAELRARAAAVASWRGAVDRRRRPARRASTSRG